MNEKIKKIDELLAALDVADEKILTEGRTATRSLDHLSEHEQVAAVVYDIADALEANQRSRDILHRLRGQVVKSVGEEVGGLETISTELEDIAARLNRLRGRQIDAAVLQAAQERVQAIAATIEGLLMVAAEVTS